MAFVMTSRIGESRVPLSRWSCCLRLAESCWSSGATGLLRNLRRFLWLHLRSSILSGPVQPRNILAVAAPIAGVLESWFVGPGQEVYQDQLLGKIRSPELESAAQQAQFDLDQTGARIAMQNGELLAAKLEHVARRSGTKPRA